MTESDILYMAVENLKDLTPMEVEIVTPLNPNGHLDVQIHIRTGTNKSCFKVEVKENVLPSSLPRWVDRLHEPGTLLIAKYISNPAKVLLEIQGINYLDISGNCFIRNGGGNIFLHIKGQRETAKNGEIKHRAFQKNGIKLIYALLLNEDLLNKTHREIASVAGISSSTVGDILTDLKAANFLVQMNEKKMALINKAELLSQWVTAFNQKLKPKLMRGRFRLRTQIWSQMNIGDESFWGGEPAADLLTNYLNPGAWTLYSNLNRRGLIQDLQLIPDEDKGNVTVYSLFWKLENKDFVLPESKTVHPLLVYAELIGSGNDRNFETAKKIYAQYLHNLID